MMRASYMLDTDTCIHVRAQRLPGMVRRFTALKPAEAVMSVVTYGELRLGAENSVDRARAVRILAGLTGKVPVEDLTLKAAEAYGEIRAHLQARGELIGQNDLWIAAHARTLGLTLVTGNEREFRRVPGLSVENWAA